MKMNLWCIGFASGILCFSFCPAATHAQEHPSGASERNSTTIEDIAANPNGKNWTSYNGDYSGQRYSRLNGINTTNISQLRAAWIFHAENSSRLEVTPVVYNGVMYVTAANTVSALDARTGRELWRHERALSGGLIDDAAAHKNRGVGLWKNRVYMETDNAHLLCLDSRSGRELWEVTYADFTKSYGATSAPLVVKDEIIVGTSGGDSGVRGFLAAYDAESGRLRWKLWTIPAPGEPGSASWPGDAYLHGGATTWMPGTYDPALNLLYWTTSNPAPDFEGLSRPGDDLYSDCVLALDADTGKLKWYFQFTPHDLYDYDANETPVLIDVDEHGERRRLLVQANRNGFLYFLDRTNGKFLKATRFLNEVTWAKGIDKTGRPILSGLIPTAAGTRICPGIEGATNWYSPSYNPETRTFYFLAMESCNLFFSKPSPYKEGATYYSTGTKRIPTEAQQKLLLAYSIPDGTLMWRYPQVGKGTSCGGTLVTAGGLVFFGDDTGSFAAVDARTGHPLWEFNTGQTLRASPMSYEVDGVQYVAIAAGSDIISFSLPH
jgi:alcohol dehydrogenase (cytochrome c)